MTSLTDVAREAGVSIAAASAVLNHATGSVRVSEPVAMRVRDAARRLHYVPNYHMRSVRRGRSDTLGLLLEMGTAELARICDQLGSHYHHALTDGAEAAAQAAGFNMLMIRPLEKQSASDQGLQFLRQRRVDALVFPAPSHNPEVLKFLANPPELPVVAIEPAVPTALPAVVFNEEAAIDLLVAHLAGLGHRQLLWLCPATAPEGRGPLFRQRAAQAGLRAQPVLFEAPREPVNDGLEIFCANAEQALAAQLANRKFTAVACYNDLTACAALRVLHQAGLRVPQDVSVTGLDNIGAEMAWPGLTTVDHHLYLMGRRAGELAMELIAGGDEAVHQYRGHRITVEPTLVVRQSTGPAPA